MAQAHLYKTLVSGSTGVPLGSATVDILVAGTATRLTGVTDRTGAAQTLPLTVTTGVLDVYTSTPQFVDVVVTPQGGTATTYYNQAFDNPLPAGSSAANPLPATGFYQRGSDGTTLWLVTIDATGHLTTTQQ